MKSLRYTRAGSASEALELAGADGCLLAGGTDLVPLLKNGIVAPSRLVDIKRATDLDSSIEETPAGGIRLGALSRLAEIEEHPLLCQPYASLQQAAAVAASPQLRNMATLAGNLLQRPRCWYFRNPRIRCWLKGGETCPASQGRNELHAVFPGDPCVAAHPSDLATSLLALEAEIRLHGNNGAHRTLAVGSFFKAPEPERRRETVLAEELIVSIELPPLPQGTRSIFLKAMQRASWGFALASVAVVLRLEDRAVAESRIALGGVAPVPRRARAAEQALAGGTAADGAIEAASQTALADALPLARNGYKVALAKALVRRALETLMQPPSA
jgi:xanthine dehydrogenase YagS FAD-binding subunit